jgi:hypothetical protein
MRLDKKMTDEKRARIVHVLREMEHTDTEVAKRFHVSWQTVKKIREEEGILQTKGSKYLTKAEMRKHAESRKRTVDRIKSEMFGRRRRKNDVVDWMSFIKEGGES